MFLNLGSFRNGKLQQLKRERYYAAQAAQRLGKKAVPAFSFGSENLLINQKVGDEKSQIHDFVKDWFDRPEDFLDVRRQNFRPEITSADKNFSFPSFADQKDTASFFEDSQPLWGRGSRMAFIILPHWNADFSKYKVGTSVIRNLFLPVATYRYFPNLSTEKEYSGQARFDIVGPNIGLTIKRFWQDILNIQYFAYYLKNTLKYDQVGIWAYSIGSPRGLVASIFSDAFDFLIMNFLAGSFSQAVLEGISTQDIAKEIEKNISREELEDIWSPLSPGRYEKYFKQLPKHTRLLQGKYDLVFGIDNNKKLVERMRGVAPSVEIEEGDFGHFTYGDIEKVIPTVNRHAKFVFKNSSLKLL